MANFAGWSPARAKKFVVTLGIALLLAGCGSSGTGSGAADTLAAPVFMSAPPSAAAQDSAYTYAIATQAAAGTVTLKLAAAPPGAVLNGNTITWTPSASQSRVANQFSLTATNAAGTAAQSWTVTPAGTVTGTFVVTYLTPQGPLLVPFDWTKAPLPPQALVPQPDGSFQTLQGSGKSDGTFTIANVPGSYYWLQPTPRAAYWTSTSSFDFGSTFISGVSAPTSVTTLSAAPILNIQTTTLNFNFSGLDGLNAVTRLEFLPDPFILLPLTFSAPAGATTFSGGALISTNFDFSQIHDGYMLQYEPLSLGALNTMVLGPQALISNLSLTNGTTNTISGTLGPSPHTSFDLNVKGSAWAALFNAAGPAPATPLGSGLALVVNPALDTSTGIENPKSTISLVMNQPTTLAPLTPSCPVSSGLVPAGSTTPPLPPPITADIDFGPLTYGDPFPSSAPRVFTFCQTASLTIPASGSVPAVPFGLVATQSTAVPTAPISPLVAPAQNPMINGSSLFVPAAIPANHVSLSWTAPAGLHPTGYRIDPLISTVGPTGQVIYSGGASFYTATTSAVLPPLLPGKTYVFVITTLLDGSANFETSPNRSSLPTASTGVVSAPITITAAQ